MQGAIVNSSKTWHLRLRPTALAPARSRAYLLINITAFRIAYIHMFLSGHALAVERLRWAERRRPFIPRGNRLCRLCGIDIEDEAHAMFACLGDAQLQTYRDNFWTEVPTFGPRIMTDLRMARRQGGPWGLLVALWHIGDRDSGFATVVGKIGLERAQVIRLQSDADPSGLTTVV